MTPPLTHILHGADYNPEQWVNFPGTVDEDFRLLHKAHMNSVSIGIFSWASLEPEEGRFEFAWMDDLFERAKKDGVRIVLATPSGGKPNWLAHAYPEVRRVTVEGRREPQCERHNHCLTSPVYRAKVHGINTQLAMRYGKHPALAAWHISNEFGGHCHCDLCFAAFREWLRAKYVTLDALNEAYWSRFWSHTYTDWSQIVHIDNGTHGLSLDWKRFMTHQCRTFIRNEIAALRPHSSVPATTNLMPLYDLYNFWEVAREVDFISWDSYPQWHTVSPELDETVVAQNTAFEHDIFRSMKGGQPFWLMETTPSQVNWAPVSPLRRPGVHRLHALQAVAHGSEAVCYFQFRKSRGSCEKLHGAVVDHVGHGETRVFREVTSLGECLEKLGDVIGSRVTAEVGLVFDYENRWALEASSNPQNKNKNYPATVLDFHAPFWKRGIAVDVIDQTADLSSYKLVVAPMLYMIRPGFAEKITAFVENGGTFVTTYSSGLVDENDLCFLRGFPGPLRELLGLRVEETDALPEGFTRQIEIFHSGNPQTYAARHWFDLIHLEGAKCLGEYREDFYAGRPALTVHSRGKGRAFYIASRNESRFQDDFLAQLADELALKRALPTVLPHGVSAVVREKEGQRFVFLMNFINSQVDVPIGPGTFKDMETGMPVSEALCLGPFESKILRALDP